MLVKISLVNSKELFHLGSIGTGDLFYKTNWPPASYLRDNSSVVFFPLEFTFKEERPAFAFQKLLRTRYQVHVLGTRAGKGGQECGLGGVDFKVTDKKENASPTPPSHPYLGTETDTHGCNPGMNACTHTHTHTHTHTLRYARSKPPPRDVTCWAHSQMYRHTRHRHCRQASWLGAHRKTEMQRDAQTPLGGPRWGTLEPSSLHAGRGQQAGWAQR